MGKKATVAIVAVICMVIAVIASLIVKNSKNTEESYVSSSISSITETLVSDTPRVSTIEQSDTKIRMELQPTQDIVSEMYMVQRGDIDLYGIVTASSNYRKEKRPLVILSHGFNNTLEMYETYADFLAKLGYIVYRFDFYGGSMNSKSGGTDMLNMSVLTEKSDLEAVVQTLSSESFVDNTSINLLGASQGGVVSTLYAAEYPDTIDRLILIFPAFVLFDDVQETYNRLGISNMEIPSVVTHKNAQLGSIYIRDALNIDINSKIKKVTSPVLIIQGTDDEVVPYQYAVNANQLFLQSELVTVDGGGHWIDRSFNDVAIPAIEKFLK